MTKTVKQMKARDRLTLKLDALFERMQAPGAATAMQKAFDTPTPTLGEIAVAAAKRAKTKRRRPG
jgi:hypothetical protein